MAGLYVHIPFCRAKCAYCDFYSGPLRAFEARGYFDAIARELAARRGEVGPFATVYVGGGTPSSVEPSFLAPFLALAPGERTVEVNPEDVTPAYAEALLAAGANRVSMGVQSLVDSELQAVGRRHSADAARLAFATLRAAGFDNISLDLIYGLPGQSLDSWRRSLDGVLELAPEHLSAYSLTYEEGTLLTARVRAGKLEEASDELVEQMYGDLCAAASAAGFVHYEISNFALPGREAVHNSAYWDMTPYLGLGPGAHSFDGNVRRANPANLKEYLTSPETAAEIEPETADNRFNDLLITALRTARGIDASVFTPDELRLARTLLEPAPGGRLRIAEAAWLTSNSILLELIR